VTVNKENAALLDLERNTTQTGASIKGKTTFA